jgi:hypothetical protein
MRKTIAGLMIGVLAISTAGGAMAAAAVPFVPVEPVQFGQLNNRAVLGLAAAQTEPCTPDSNGNGCALGGEEGGFSGSNAALVVAGVGVVAIGIAVASGGGSGSTPSSP